jgi:hypothetical protein
VRRYCQLTPSVPTRTLRVCSRIGQRISTYVDEVLFCVGWFAWRNPLLPFRRDQLDRHDSLGGVQLIANALVHNLVDHRVWATPRRASRHLKFKNRATTGGRLEQMHRILVGCHVALDHVGPELIAVIIDLDVVRRAHTLASDPIQTRVGRSLLSRSNTSLATVSFYHVGQVSQLSTIRFGSAAIVNLRCCTATTSPTSSSR